MRESTRQIVALLGKYQRTMEAGKVAALTYEKVAQLLSVDLVKAKRMVHSARDEGFAMVKGGPGKGKKAIIFLTVKGIAQATGGGDGKKEDGSASE